MIGLIVLLVGATWVLVSYKMGTFVASAFRFHPLSRSIGMLTFLSAMFLPFLDEAIGRWQFKRLCESEDRVWVSPSAQSVLAAKSVGASSKKVGYAVPIREQRVEYADSVTGESFYLAKAFHTKGGFVMRSGLGMDGTTSCWPEGWESALQKLSIDELLKRKEP